MGLRGMIDDMIARCDASADRAGPGDLDALAAGDRRVLARTVTAIEDGGLDPSLLVGIRERGASLSSPPVIGITGTGGSGKSSLTDEIVRRLRLDRRDALRIAVLAVDPSRRKTGGALLGDRIRMNAIGHPNVYMRSLATRVSGSRGPGGLLRHRRRHPHRGLRHRDRGDQRHRPGRRGHRPVRGRAGVRDDAGVRRREPARKDRHARLRRPRRHQQVRPQGRRGCAARREQAGAAQPRGVLDPLEEMPVHGTIASRFNDDGVTALYHRLVEALRERGLVD